MLANPLLPRAPIAADIPLYTVPGAGMLGKRMRVRPLPADFVRQAPDASLTPERSAAIFAEIERAIGALPPAGGGRS